MKSNYLTFFVFIFSLVGLIFLRHHVVKTGYELQKIEKHVFEVREENLRLVDELNRLTSPRRLKEMARAYQLQERTPQQVIFLSRSSQGSVNEETVTRK